MMENRPLMFMVEPFEERCSACGRIGEILIMERWPSKRWCRECLMKWVETMQRQDEDYKNEMQEMQT